MPDDDGFDMFYDPLDFLPSLDEIIQAANEDQAEEQAKQRAADKILKDKKDAVNNAKRSERTARATATRSRNRDREQETRMAIANRYAEFLPDGVGVDFRNRSYLTPRTEMYDNSIRVVVPMPRTAGSLYKCLLGIARGTLTERGPSGSLRRPAWRCLWEAHQQAMEWMEDEGIAVSTSTVNAIRRKLRTLTQRSSRGLNSSGVGQAARNFLAETED